MKSIVIIWEGNSFSFEVDEEMVKIEFGEYFAETGEYDKTWSVELSDEEINLETGLAIEEFAYVELTNRFISAFKKDWENVISEMGGVELTFPEGEKEIITA